MFKPENELERVLVQAATDPAMRPQFYALLAQSAIFTPNYGAAAEPAFRPVRNGDRDLLPIFSSLPRLQHFVGQETRFLEMQVLEFLRQTRGAEVVLNPGSDYGKEFTASEITQMLDGWNTVTTRVTDQPAQVLLGQPAQYPQVMTETLSRLFRTHKEVESAYLALMDTQNPEDPPHLLVGVKATGNWQETLTSASLTLAGLEIPNAPVDFIHILGPGSLEDYLLTTKPFYQRKLFGIF